MVDGKELDLYQLYWAVTAQGGFEKVIIIMLFIPLLSPS